MDVEADRVEGGVVEAVAAVEEDGRFDHVGVDAAIVQLLVLAPVGQHGQRVRPRVAA